MGLTTFAYRCELMNNYLMCSSGTLADSPDIGLLKGEISRAISRHKKYIVRFLLTS